MRILKFLQISLRRGQLRLIRLLALLLLSSTSCTLYSPPLFYHKDSDCRPLNPIRSVPLELTIDEAQGPVSYLHLFTEVGEEQTRVAGVSPLLGSEFVVSVSRHTVVEESAPRFLSRHMTQEISALAVLLQNHIARTKGEDMPSDMECRFRCGSIELAARCSNKRKSFTVEFYDERLAARYRFHAVRPEAAEVQKKNSDLSAAEAD